MDYVEYREARLASDAVLAKEYEIETAREWAVRKSDPKLNRLVQRVGYSFVDAGDWWLMSLSQARVAIRCGCELHRWQEEFGGGAFVPAELPVA